MIGIKNQQFGVEIEFTGITRREAAKALADYFQTSPVYIGAGYDAWAVEDFQGRQWKIMSDSSIRAEYRVDGQYLRTTDRSYQVEFVTPVLRYEDMEIFQGAIRALRHAGGKANNSCGLHVHVDAANHNRQSLKNLMSIMYSKEDILFKALKVDERRVERWCQKVREPMLERIRKLPTNTTMERLKREWYEGGDGSYEHYNWTRYYALNLHSVFYRGTLEWRCFEGTLHAGKVRANITLALAISAQAINQKRTVMRKTEISENPAFTFRTFLLRLGLIGREYKNVREHLLSNLPGDRAWRYDKSQYPSLQNRSNQER